MRERIYYTILYIHVLCTYIIVDRSLYCTYGIRFMVTYSMADYTIESLYKKSLVYVVS